jgi:hypothetical protein
MIGCADNRPDCCPSLKPITPSQSTSTTTVVQLVTDQTAVASALSANPLTICPADYSEIQSVCCPMYVVHSLISLQYRGNQHRFRGFTIYGQEIFGQTPCYTVLSTSFAVPSAVLAQISAIKSEILATATTSAPTISVNVVENEVFALSLPHTKQSGLSTATQVGIGVGSTAAGFAFLFLILSILLRRYRRKREERGSVASVSLVPDQSTISQPTSGHISPFQNPTSGSGSGSGDPDGLPTNVPWPYNPNNRYAATNDFGNPLAMAQPVPMAAMTGPTETFQPQQHGQSPSPEYYAQQAPGELASRQAPGELAARQTDPFEADTVHPRPGGYSILPDGRIYPHPQELG